MEMSFLNVDKLLFYIKRLDDFQKMTFFFNLKTHLKKEMSFFVALLVSRTIYSSIAGCQTHSAL